MISNRYEDSICYMIDPVFYEANIDGNKVVLLEQGEGTLPNAESSIFENPEQLELSVNHVHIFYRVKKCEQKRVREISIAIMQNLGRALMESFPEKDFWLLLELNYKDSVILRFCQNYDDRINPFNEEPANFPFELIAIKVKDHKLYRTIEQTTKKGR